RSVGALREREARLERACRDKDGRLKQLLVETEKLSAEVLALRGRSARLQLQLEVGTVPWCHPMALSPPVTPCHSTCPVSPRVPSPPLFQVQQKQHRDTVAVYRTHLLRAAQGFMDEGVHAALLRILRDQEGAG
ncbi:ANR35 protein, partial [Formicarius rufipectus]|nr:ANR35 protein [Formicarius rufipectus]